MTPIWPSDEAALTAELLGAGRRRDQESILARLLRGARHAKSMADAAAEQIEDMQMLARAVTNVAPGIDLAQHGIRDHGRTGQEMKIELARPDREHPRPGQPSTDHHGRDRRPFPIKFHVEDRDDQKDRQSRDYRS